MSRAAWVAVAAFLALTAIGIGTFASNVYGSAHRVLAASDACGRASHGPGAQPGAFARCMKDAGFPAVGAGVTCSRDPEVKRFDESSEPYAHALAACLERDGEHASIGRTINVQTGRTTYTVSVGSP
jgi:hypothetical protein